MKNIDIETERLFFRRFTISDAQMMFDNWTGNPEVTTYLTWPAHESIEETESRLQWRLSEYEKNQSLSWAIVEKKSGEVIGSIDVVEENQELKMKEIGYVLGKSYWGNGYMTEALQSVIDYIFVHTDTNRVEATHDSQNIGSGRVMVKAGLLFEGILKQRGKNNRGIVDVALYGLTKAEYFKENSQFQIEQLPSWTPGIEELLLEADPDISHIKQYSHEKTFCLSDKNQLIGVIVLGNEDNSSLEIVNLAINPKLENQGYGSKLVVFAIHYAQKQQKHSLIIKTSTTSIKQLYLYQKHGFRIKSINRDYFVNNYSELLEENGLKIRDQVVLIKEDLEEGIDA